MRRSRSIRLTLLAAVAVSLPGCGDNNSVDTTDSLVSGVPACVARFGPTAEQECREAVAQAEETHFRTAPRYSSVDVCREQTGADCQIMPPTRAADGSILGPAIGMAVPVMAGIVISRMLSQDNAARAAMPVYNGRPPPECAGGTPAPGCPPQSTRTPGGGGSAMFLYSGNRYAGSSPSGSGNGATFTPTPQTSATLASAANTRIASASVSRGGFGATARGFGGGGS